MVRWVMVWRIYSLDRVTGDLGVVTVFSVEDAWTVFLSQSRFSRVVDGDRYKSWLETVISESKGSTSDLSRFQIERGYS